MCLPIFFFLFSPIAGPQHAERESERDERGREPVWLLGRERRFSGGADALLSLYTVARFLDRGEKISRSFYVFILSSVYILTLRPFC